MSDVRVGNYANFRNLFKDLGLFINHPKKDSAYIINPSLFNIAKRAVMTLAQLKDKQKNQAIAGEKAEKYVLRFERKRLGLDIDIEWISETNVTAGYDIASFNNSDDSKWAT